MRKSDLQSDQIFWKQVDICKISPGIFIRAALSLAGTPLQLPHLAELGLLEAYRLKNGVYPAGMSSPDKIHGAWAYARETSRGKDTPSGHWEIAGVPVPFDWSYFPRSTPFFPEALSNQIFDQGLLEGSLGNCHGSGTEIIKEFGEEHIISSKNAFGFGIRKIS